MSFEEFERVEDLVALVVNAARGQGLNIAPTTEVRIIEHCSSALDARVLTSNRDVVVGAAGLVTAGVEMSRERRQHAVTPDHVDEGYWAVLRPRPEFPEYDLDCVVMINRCLRSTVLARELTLRETFDTFRSLLDTVEEGEARRPLRQPSAHER